METKDIILELRTKNGLSQDELAEKLYVTRQAVSRWENGETVPNTDGKFVYKSLDELTDFLVGHMSNEKWPPDQARAYFEEQLPKLKRWKKKKKID